MSNLFCDFVFDCDLTQLVAPTHNKGNCHDLVLSSSPEAVGLISVSSNIRQTRIIPNGTIPLLNPSVTNISNWRRKNTICVI